MTSERHRMWASAAFVGVLIVIGVPLWWKTTEVYRVALPYERISALDELSFAITSYVTVVANDEPTAQQLVGLLQETFNDSDLIKLNVETKVMEPELRKTLYAVADESEAIEVVSEAFDTKKPNHMYLVQRPRLYSHVWIGTERVVLFKEAESAKTVVQVLEQWVYQVAALRGARAARGADAARRTRMPPAAAYDVTLSVVHPRVDELHVDFDAAAAVEDYIGSFVDELEELHNFTLKSQWLYLLELDFQAKQVVEPESAWGRHYAAAEERLPHLLTPLEKRAGSHMSPRAAIHLVLYANPCLAAPLYIYDKSNKRVGGSVDAFMSPKWGGVVVGNPSYDECREQLQGAASSSTYTPSVRLVMGTFLVQLRQLLGFNTIVPIDNATLAPLRSVAPRRWELDALIKIRTLEQVISAKLTLQSLSQLLGKISNIVINDEVGASVQAGVAAAEAAAALLARGSPAAAHRQAAAAHSAAEAAFTDPTLLALLYFPDDQKYAVYIPLFLPVMIPVIFSLNNIVSWLRGKPHKKEKID